MQTSIMIGSKIKLLLLLSLSVLLAAVGLFPIQALSQEDLRFTNGSPIGKNEHWVIRYNQAFRFPESERACIMIGVYRSGSFLIIIEKADGEKWIAITNSNWKSIQSGQKYAIAFQFDRNIGRSIGSGQGIVSDLGKGVLIRLDKGFTSAFARSKGLAFSYEGTEVDTFSLRGSRAAIDSVRSCSKAYFRSDPFQKKSAPQISDPFAKSTDFESLDIEAPDEDNVDIDVDTIKGRCSLNVNGITYIKGPCDIRMEKSGSFDFNDGKLKTKCIEYDLGPKSCTGASTIVVAKGTFGSLITDDGRRGYMYWNAGEFRRAQGAIENLTRKGACWSTQDQTTRLCAWR